MFENLKNLQKLKQIQEDFKKEKLTVEKRGVLITMNGNFEVEDIKLNSELNLEEQQDALKEALNEARENIQRTLAKSLMSSGLGF